MAEHGGYRKPGKPAAVSGPGALSQRTDTGPQAKRNLPDAAYGEQAEFQAAQSGAPMQGSGSAGQAGPMGGGPAQGGTPIDVVPFGAPSTRPEEPVTAGAPAGAGPGPSALGLIDPAEQLSADDIKAIQDALPYLTWMSSLPGASPSTRAYVRTLRSRLP